jgi:putative membrane protein insertion efficiency factor
MRFRVIAVVVVIVVAAWFVHDVRRPPDAQWTTHGVLVALRGYRYAVSPVLARMGVSCRFSPTCSRYATAAFAKYGFVRGSYLTVWRVARCGPWTPIGTRDDP